MLFAGEDIIDEALRYFRANVLFRKYDVKGTACALPACGVPSVLSLALTVSTPISEVPPFLALRADA